MDKYKKELGRTRKTIYAGQNPPRILVQEEEEEEESKGKMQRAGRAQ
jgi:hypothetical protein